VIANHEIHLDSIRNASEAQPYLSGPSVLPLRTGRFLVIWGQGRPENSEARIECRLFDDNGRPLTDPLIASGETYHCSASTKQSAVELDDGRILLAWHATDGRQASIGVFARILDIQQQEKSTPAVRISSAEMHTRELSVVPVGNEILVGWVAISTGPKSNRSIKGRIISRLLKPITEEFELSSVDSLEDWAFALGRVSANEAAVTWTSSTLFEGPGVHRFLAQKYDSLGRSVGDVVVVRDFGPMNGYDSKFLLPLGTDRFLILYVEWDTASEWMEMHLFSRAFAPTGKPYGPAQELSRHIVPFGLRALSPFGTLFERRFALISWTYQRIILEVPNKVESQIFLRLLDIEGTARGDEHKISGDDNLMNDHSSIVRLNGERFAAVWLAYAPDQETHHVSVRTFRFIETE